MAMSTHNTWFHFVTNLKKEKKYSYTALSNLMGQVVFIYNSSVDGRQITGLY